MSLVNFSTVSGQFGSARRGPLSAIYRERCPQPGPVFRSSSVTSEEILSSSSPSSCSHPQNCFWLLASSPASQPSPGTKEVSMRPTTTTLPVTEEPFPPVAYQKLFLTSMEKYLMGMYQAGCLTAPRASVRRRRRSRRSSARATPPCSSTTATRWSAPRASPATPPPRTPARATRVGRPRRRPADTNNFSITS